MTGIGFGNVLITVYPSLNYELKGYFSITISVAFAYSFFVNLTSCFVCFATNMLL